MIDNSNIKPKVISALFWKLMERGGTQGIQFIVQIILARLLLPEDYGTIALIVVFINIANLFVNSGFTTALIQKKDADETDFNSVFYMSSFIAIMLYIILFFTAPIIAGFYEDPLLVPVLRVLSIMILVGVYTSIQNTIVSKKLQFKKSFISSILSGVLSGSVGIVMAYLNFGVWALVAQQLLSQVMFTVTMLLIVKWKPKFLYSSKRVKKLFSYSWKLLVSNIIDTLDSNLSSLIIGKISNSTMLGFYSRGASFPSLIVENINGSIQSVMLPALSSQQDDINKVKNMVRRSITTSSFLIFPMMVGLAVVAKPLVIVILTEKWLDAVPFLQIFCLVYAFWPIHTANLQAINALGRSDIFLKLEIIKKIIGISILLISIRYGVYAIALSSTFSGIVSLFINTYPNKKLLDYGIKEQMLDILPSMIIALLMGVIVYSISFFNLSVWLTLIMQILSGIVIYMGTAYLLKLECLEYLFSTARELLAARR
ncbi:MAG: lipopolysaccharide biosynthesis protein [Clostridiaceae bacterium]|nr:lipopolysaccharide biosynthesis protein [Clostridiaceae bacterium]